MNKPLKIAVAGFVGLLILGAMIPEEEPKSKSKAKPVPKPAATTTPPAKPKPVRLDDDVRKNIGDAMESVESVSCDKDKWCEVIAELSTTWSGDEDEIVQQMGDAFEQVFRDTDARWITLHAQGETVDDLGNESFETVFVIGMKRSGWMQVDWENLKYQDATKLRQVAEVYNPRISFG